MAVQRGDELHRVLQLRRLLRRGPHLDLGVLPGRDEVPAVRRERAAADLTVVDVFVHGQDAVVGRLPEAVAVAGEPQAMIGMAPLDAIAEARGRKGGLAAGDLELLLGEPLDRADAALELERLARDEDVGVRGDGHRDLGGLARRVRPAEDLVRRLAEIVDLRDDGHLVDRVRDGVDVNGVLVGEVVEHVLRLDGRLPLLLEAEDEVDPVVEVLTDVLALEGLSHDPDEAAGVVVGPRRQLHVVHLLLPLRHAEVESVGVLEKVREVVELGD
mmetsp:Transcript_44910/g.72132  ORF Transcript_44910/g.72132 Transcript_44910/m.72132 type:complete len:272 (-) Transcript_44910:1091-1906(-)